MRIDQSRNNHAPTRIDRVFAFNFGSSLICPANPNNFRALDPHGAILDHCASRIHGDHYSTGDKMVCRNGH
jgi:hypothetical protein